MSDATVTISESWLASFVEEIHKRIVPALDVIDDVPQIVKDRAALGNEDVDGNQMPAKKPRPKRAPRNMPNMACVETGEMFDHSRWTTGNDRWAAECVYNPPAHFEYLISKEPEHGGRKWITPDKMNDNARAEIEAKIREVLSK